MGNGSLRTKTASSMTDGEATLIQEAAAGIETIANSMSTIASGQLEDRYQL